MVVRRRAYAKVNLTLAVGQPLPAGDAHAGMHPIASWMHAIDLWDDVQIERGARGDISIAWAPDAPRASPIDWPTEKDLGARAHRLMEREAGRELPAAVRLTKRIPVGGGLGGGSSDAAAVMLGVNEAFGLGLPIARLAELSRELGSDVAFFLDAESVPRPALVEGLGDRVRRLAPTPAWVVLVVPGFGCPTGAVYKAFDRLPAREGRGAQAAAGLHKLFNDLTDAACVVEPRVRGLLAAVEQAAGVAPAMSGSGSTVFVPAPDQARAATLSGKIRAALPDVTVLDVRLV